MKFRALIFLFALSCVIISNTSASELVYTNPRVFNVTYSFELTPDPAKIDRTKDLKLWVPIPREWDTQEGVKIVSVNPPPHGEYNDPEHGNPMLFWDLGKEPEQDLYKVEIKFRLEAYEFHPEVNPEQIGTYDKTSDEYIFYTRDSHSVYVTPKVRELAHEAVGDEKNPYLQAQRIIRFVHRKVRYKILDHVRGRGIGSVLDHPVKDESTGEEYYEGACCQRSALIIACCRALGIPARSVHGYIRWRPWVKGEDLLKPHDYSQFVDPNLTPTGLAGAQYFGHMEPHTWTEFYIPNYGWIPVDGRRIRPLDNKRWVIAKGRDIKIGPHCPQEESHGYGPRGVLLNAGRADKFHDGVWNITRAGTAKVGVILALDPFPADAFTEYSGMLYPEAKAERELREWREYTLGWIDHKTRGSPDKHATLAAAYGTDYRGHLLCYRRGAFVCHMLRAIVGDERFFRIFGEYQDLRLQSREPVSTARFQQIAENVYGKPLGWFFSQWAKEMGFGEETEIPEFKLASVTATKDGEIWSIRGHLLQVSDTLFRVPMELVLETEGGEEHQRMWQENRDTGFEFHVSSRPKQLTVDPNYEVLKIQKMPPHLFWFWDADPNLLAVYGTIAEADANKAAVDRFNDCLGLDREKIKSDSDVGEEDLEADCIILFGRPATNRIARQFRDAFPIKFDGSKFTWQDTTYDKPTQGAVQIIRHPVDPKRLIMLCAGLSGEATLRISESYLHDAQSSYVIFDITRLPPYEWFNLDNVILHGDWEIASDLVWVFPANEH